MDNDAYSKMLAYIDENPLAIIGTLNPDGSPHGAVVYICPDDRRHAVYFITKTGTQKYKNIGEHDRVSLTVVNPADNSTLQANGQAFIVNDAAIIDMTVKQITRQHALAVEWLPPIAKIRAGAYVVVGVKIVSARLSQFNGMEIGDERIFTRV